MSKLDSTCPYCKGEGKNVNGGLCGWVNSSMPLGVVDKGLGDKKKTRKKTSKIQVQSVSGPPDG